MGFHLYSRVILISVEIACTHSSRWIKKGSTKCDALHTRTKAVFVEYKEHVLAECWLAVILLCFSACFGHDAAGWQLLWFGRLEWICPSGSRSRCSVPRSIVSVRLCFQEQWWLTQCHGNRLPLAFNTSSSTPVRIICFICLLLKGSHYNRLIVHHSHVDKKHTAVV